MTLPNGEDYLRVGLMDPTGAFAYFGTATAPGRVIQIGLQESQISFDFSGFHPPIRSDAWNQVKAGQVVPVKFSLGGDYGLAIFSDDYPASHAVSCNDGAENGELLETTTADQSGLSYDPVSDVYVYVWKTEKTWQSTLAGYLC